MTACEKCWADAYQRMMFVNPLKSQTEHYHELLEERKDDPCRAVENTETVEPKGEES